MARFGLRARVIASAAVVAAVGAFMAPALGLGVPLLIRNTGGSMPRGFYLWSHAPPAAKGEVIVVREPEHFRWSWLMKRVVATAGDRFCWRPEIGTHAVGDQPMPPPSADALRLGLRSWQGCRVLAPGEIIGYGQGPDSYDSRYLGPIREVHLWGVYRPVWIDESAENHLSEIQFDRSLTDNMEWPLRRRSLANGRPPRHDPRSP